MNQRLNGLPCLGRGLMWALVLCMSACGGVTNEPNVGSESHFLRYCESDNDCADEGLNCVSGVCTVGCVVDDPNSCEDLPASSVCTNETVEPGEVAVCDSFCDDSTDCSQLSSEHQCASGVCRAPRKSVPLPEANVVARLAGRAPGREELLCIEEGLIPTAGVFACPVMEVSFSETLDCSAAGRAYPGVTILEGLAASGICGEDSDTDCEDASVCELIQLTGSDLDICRNDATPADELSVEGFCVIEENVRDAEGNLSAGGIEDGVNPLLSHCPEGRQSAFRFVGANTPLPSTTLWGACDEAPYTLDSEEN